MGADFLNQPPARIGRDIRPPISVRSQRSGPHRSACRSAGSMSCDSRRGRMHADELTVATLQNVVTDDLFAAVIDR